MGNSTKGTHSPGPWKKVSGCSVLSAEGGLVASVYDGQDYTAELSGERTHNTNASDANARLIAASPDLLAQLKVLLSAEFGPDYMTHPQTQGDTMWGRARAAIAKAEGGA